MGFGEWKFLRSVWGVKDSSQVSGLDNDHHSLRGAEGGAN